MGIRSAIIVGVIIGIKVSTFARVESGFWMTGKASTIGMMKINIR